MRKIMVLVVVLALGLPATLFAASIGGALTQGKGKLAIGVEQEFIFDRDMKFDKTTFALTSESEGMKIDHIYRTLAKVSYGLLDNLDIYVKLGAADFEAKRSWYNAGIEDAREDYKGKSAFAYGFGLKGTYALKDDWLIGADIQYLRHVNDFSEPFVIIGDRYTGSGKATFQEWQVALYLAKSIGNFVPYIGGKYSDLRIVTKNSVPWAEVPNPWSAKTRDKADDIFGVFVGTDYKITNNWKVNIEGRFIDETAMSVGVTYKF